MTSVVTSCSARGWKLYGERFTSTFDAYWPPEVTLYVVSEDVLPISSRGRVIVQSLSASAQATSFLERHVADLWVHGNSATPRPAGVAPAWRDRAGYSFRYDAYKFCRKVFAIDLVAGIERSGKLLWVDADALTFAPVPLSLLTSVLPDTAALSYLARERYHPECGFVGYNLSHPECLPFIQAFARLYSSDDVFALGEWHDSWVFQWLVKHRRPAAHHIPHRSQGHPFINSELGLYMDHLKGKRKSAGRSAPAEQLKHKGLPYWEKS